MFEPRMADSSDISKRMIQEAGDNREGPLSVLPVVFPSVPPSQFYWDVRLRDVDHGDDTL